MNRFEYLPAQLKEGEIFVARDTVVRIYDGHEKCGFDEGDIILTTHRIIWGKVLDIAHGVNTISLQHRYINSFDEETASSGFFGRKKRIIINLHPPASDKVPGPRDHSCASFIKLSGKDGLDPNFVQSLYETVNSRVWEVVAIDEVSYTPSEEAQREGEPVRRIKLRTGIVGIERGLQEKQKQQDQNISLAFQDLNKLMTMAKDMVGISKIISAKIREKQGDISEDETIRFKSYLMSLGVDDPVTRDSVQSDSEYLKRLAQQICEMLLDPITEAGGMMSMADVYCRVNRARGLELLSPEDLLNACKIMSGPVKLRTFPSGSMVLQLDSHDDELVATETRDTVEERESISVEELAKLVKISVILAQERLLAAERAGYVCRDESIEGLRFYPNLFLKNSS
ncbi:vacuolar protein-sorting-associated protein 36 [Culicoides brevitarsis]|uniref:vacuolar protein-sorting-associated protein 36 n=1 Tax=Culicoides brevitarsis TaxID=469753 RepID=UPI00307B5ADC